MTTISKNSGRIVDIANKESFQIEIITELNTDINIGDYVFIIGGDLDNTNIDISNIYSNGYEVIYVDNSINTITIQYDVLLSNTIIDSYSNSNFYISTASVIDGEIHGGNFNGGTLGKVNSKKLTFADARINNGQFLGGNFLQGEAIYTNTNNNGTIKNYDKTLSNIIDDTAFKGYTEFVTGDISKIYDSEIDTEINGSIYNTITISNTGLVEFSDFMPYNIENNMRILFKNSSLNTKIYTFNELDYSTKTLQLIPNNFEETYKDVNNVDVVNNIIDIFKQETIVDAKIEIYSNKTNIGSVAINNNKIYGGNFNNVQVRGGEIYDAAISNSELLSKKNVLDIHGGVISKSNTSNINFNGGILKDSVWDGDSLYDVVSIREIDRKLAFKVKDEYYSLIDVENKVFISYLKDSNNSYLPMYDEDPYKKLELVNYQETEIKEKNGHFVTNLKYGNYNYQNMKVSQTNFNNGVMENNTVVSGLLKGDNFKATLDTPVLDSNKYLRLVLSQTDILKFKINDLVEISNLTLKNELVLNSITQTFTYEEIFGTSRVYDIDVLNYILIIELPKNNNIIADNDYQNEGNIITAEKIDANRDILITKNMFVSGNIESGYINNKIIRKANLNGKNKDKTLISNESYYKRVSGDNAVFTSDTILYGASSNSIITNNTGKHGNMSDTIVGNLINQSDIKRGLMYNLRMERGAVTNAYIDKSIWNGGVYKNGYGLYNKDSNRSGVENDGVFTQMSAPSVVYVNNDKIKLAEPSTYQENYKIIFKDFDIFGEKDGINNNVFTVKNRNELSDILYINNTNKTYICVNDISDYIITENIYYLVDKTYHRVFKYDKTLGVVDSYDINETIVGITLNNEDLYIATNNDIYVLKNDIIELYSSEFSDISTIYYVNDNLIVVTKNNTIHYNNNSISFSSNIINSGNISKSCFVNNVNNSNLYYYYTIDSKIYRVLFNLTTNISFQNEILVYDLVDNIGDISGVITATGVDLFVVDVNNNTCYRLGDEFVVGVDIVNKNILNFKSKVYLSKAYNGKLYSVVDYNKNATNCVIVESNFYESVVGFGNLYSTVKVENRNELGKFYYYDDKTNRIVYTDLNGAYSDDMSVDTTGYIVEEIVYGGNNIAYALLNKGVEYYIGRLFISNGILTITMGKIQMVDNKISKLFYDGSNLYFLYSTNIICRYSFTLTPTDITSLTKYTFNSSYIIKDYYIESNNMYIIFNENNRYLLEKTTLSNPASLITLVDNSSTVLKSVIVRNNIIYLLNENGVVLLNDNFECVYDSDLLFLSGNFDNIEYFDDEYFTTNFSYITKRYKFKTLSNSNKIAYFNVDTTNNNNLFVLSENVIRYNDTIVCGEYKIKRLNTNNDVSNSSAIFNSSMNPQNPMVAVNKILNITLNSKSYAYFVEYGLLYRLSITNTSDIGYLSAVSLDSDNKFKEATVSNYRTFYHYNSDKNFVVVKELVYNFNTSIIIDISTGSVTGHMNSIMLLSNTGTIYILDNDTSQMYNSTTTISGPDKIIPIQTSGSELYLVSSIDQSTLQWVGVNNFTASTFDVTINNSNNKTVVLDNDEILEDIFIAKNSFLCVKTSTRTFFAIWDASLMIETEYPFIIDGVLLLNPILSRNTVNDYIYLYENSNIYRLDLSTSNLTEYNVTYLEKSPSKNYTFMSIDNNLGDKYVTRQKQISKNGVILVNDKVDFSDISSTINITKIVSVNDNILYVLMSDGILYKVEFDKKSKTLISTGYNTIKYRSGSNNQNIPGLLFRVTDICYFNGKLLFNLEIQDGVKYYNDVFVLESNNTTHKDGINFLYNYKQNINGTYDTTVLHPMDINGNAIITPTSELVYLYESAVSYSTKIFANKFGVSDTITLSFYESNTILKYVNRINNFSCEYVYTDNTHDYYLVTIPSYNNTISTTGVIYPINNSNTAVPVNVDFVDTIPDYVAINSDQTYMKVSIEYRDDMIPNNCVLKMNYVETVDLNNFNDFFVIDNSNKPFHAMITDNINLLYNSSSMYDPSGVVRVMGNDNGILLKNLDDDLNEKYVFPRTFSIDSTNTKTSYLESVDVFDIVNLITNFIKYSNIYIETMILKLYKTIYNIATPFISARIINDSIINNGSDINSGGTSKTLYFMNSVWNNGNFTGSWNEPNKVDNLPVSKTSFFVNGSFTGDFHKGFFLGGDITSESSLKPTIIYNGHMIANTNNINIDSNTLISTYRYDIVSMVVGDGIMKLDIDKIDFNNNKIENDLQAGTIITIPKVFKSDKLYIDNIVDLPINVNGSKCVMLNIPSDDISLIDRIGINKNILIFSKNNASLNNYFKVIDKKFANNILSLVIESNIDVNTVKITGNKDLYVSLNEYFILNKDDNNGYFIEIGQDHLLPYIDVVGGVVRLHTNNFKQLFTTSFSSGFYDLNIKSNTVKNVYMNNVSYNGKIIDGCVIEESDIISEKIYNSLIYSGDIKSDDIISSHILCVDKKGYLVDNQEYISNIQGDISGSHIKILSYSYDSLNDMIMLTTDGVLDNISKYSLIGLRGFTGENSARIGANYSVIHRVENISDSGNAIFIKNNVFSVNDTPNLLLVNQTMELRDTSGQNLRAKSADILQLSDYTFKTAISFSETDESTWVIDENGTNIVPDILLVDDGYQIKPRNSNVDIMIYQPLRVSYTIAEWKTIFIESISSNLELKYDLLDVNKNSLLSVKWDGSITNPIVFNSNNNDNASISDSDIKYFAININIKIAPNVNDDGFLSRVFLNSFINAIDFVKNYEFNFAFVSNSSISLNNSNYNNGNITNAVWNSGIFNGGVFNGLWFGSDPYSSYSNTYTVLDKKIIGLPTILNNKEVYVKFIEKNENGVITQVYVPIYALVINNSIDLLTYPIINMVDGVYDIIIYDINDRNILFGGEISNTPIPTQSLKFDVPNSKNGMLIKNYLSSELYDKFIITLDYDKNIQSDISPLLSFINNETMVGIRIYYDAVSDKIVFVDEMKNVLPGTTINLINNIGSVTLGNNTTVTVDINDKNFIYDLNYIGKSAFRLNNKYEYSIFESRINNIKIEGVNSSNNIVITNFDFLYQDKFISSDYIFNDDKTYAFNGQNKFRIGELSNINPLIDLNVVVEKNGTILYLTSTVDFENNVSNKYSISLQTRDVDGTFYMIDVVEEFQSGVNGVSLVSNVLYTTDIIKYCDKTHIVLSKDTIYVNGLKSGNFVSLNRNIIQYTNKTDINIGFMDLYSGNEIDGITGYITDINVWKNGSYNDVYDIYLTDVLPKTDLSIKRDSLYYSINDNYKKLNNQSKSNISDVYFTNMNGYNNIEWMSIEPTQKYTFDSIVDNADYVRQFTLSNMVNFQFFGKKYNTDDSGKLDINVSCNGYIFFDLYNSVIGGNYVLPLGEFKYKTESDMYKSFTNMDAIIANTYLGSDITKYGIGFVDKLNYAIFVFYYDNKETYRVYIDKITSTISMYISDIVSDNNQKLFGLMRKDGVDVFIQDDKYVFEKYANGDKDVVYNNSRTYVDDRVINNKIIISYQPLITNDVIDESNIAYKLFTNDYSGLLDMNNITYLGNSYEYNPKKYDISQYSYMTTSPNNYYVEEIFSGELYDKDKTSVIVPRVSYFNGGQYNSQIWYNGVFVKGVITRNEFIWKFGLKLNGEINTEDDNLSKYAHWLGGYCEGDNEKGLLCNVIWYRGKHSGGMFKRGYIFAYNYDMDIENEYTVFDKMLIYSDVTKKKTNIYTDIFIADKKIQLVPNTEYELSVPIDGNTIPTIDVDLISLFDNKNVNIIKTVKYQYDSINGVGNYITKSSNETTEQISPVTNKMIISVRFNSGNTNSIEFSSVDIQGISNTRLGDYKLMGFKTITPNIDINLLEDFNTVWNSGIVKNKNSVLNYQSLYTKTYKVSDTTITLPLIDTTILGGLWLSGVFDGGIIANVFWNSVDIENGLSTSTNMYDIKIRHQYNIDKSVFRSGKMINSIWFGGKVDNENNKQNVVFGDLLSNYQIYKINDDYKEPNNFIGYLKSTLPNAYKTVLGKKIFTGYYLTNDSTISNEQIEYNRVTTQNNTDGIMSVYFHRGDISNSIIQYSILQSYDMNNANNYDMTATSNCISIKDSHIFMSQINGVLFKTTSTSSDVSKLHLTTPNSLVYQSEWNYGMWIVDSGIDAGVGTDNLITDALISRSIWNTGVFYGGTINNSIWRSGFNEAIKYSNDITTMPSSDNVGWVVSNNVTTYKDYSLNSFNITDNDVRYVGHVDNCASIFVNGRMNGCIWHGGVFKRGMFTDKTYINPTKTFDTVDEPINRSGFVQKSVFARGVILGGYFGKYIIKNSTTFNLPHDISTYILSYSADKMTDNNTMLGTNDVTSDTHSVFLTRKNMRVNNNPTTIVGDYPYFCVINGLMSGGYLYNDVLLPNNDSVLFNTNSRIGNAYISIQQDEYTFENGIGNYITLNPTDPYVYDDKYVNIKVSVWSNNEDISWRHNIYDLDQTTSVFTDYYYYGDNTTVSGVSIAQGDGSILHDNMYGEPIYRNQLVSVPDNQFDDTDFSNSDFKI